VLSDKDKRGRYDQFGHAGVDPNFGAGGGAGGWGTGSGGVDFDLGDIFGSFFGGGGGFGGFGGGRSDFYLVLSGIFADPEHLVKISFISQGKLLLFTYNVLLRDCKAIPQPVILFCKAALCTGASWHRPITAYYNTVSYYCAARAASGRRVADPYKNLCVGFHNAAMCGFSASLIKAGNHGILCETRREVLPARERTLCA